MTEVAYFVLGEFPCSIHKHNTLGHLSGYIGVPKAHPWYGKDYDAVVAQVHGGLTYFGHERVSFRPSKARGEFMSARPSEWSSEEEDQFEAIPRWDSKEQEPYPHDTGLDVWWLGFDCAHYGDLVPGWDFTSILRTGTYKDEHYVRTELEKLVRQAAEAVSYA